MNERHEQGITRDGQGRQDTYMDRVSKDMVSDTKTGLPMGMDRVADGLGQVNERHGQGKRRAWTGLGGT